MEQVVAPVSIRAGNGRPVLASLIVAVAPMMCLDRSGTVSPFIGNTLSSQRDRTSKPVRPTQLAVLSQWDQLNERQPRISTNLPPIVPSQPYISTPGAADNLAILTAVRRWVNQIDLDGSPRQLRMLLNTIIKHSRHDGIGRMSRENKLPAFVFRIPARGRKCGRRMLFLA